MSLIQCPKCGNVVSNRVNYCPKCGAPMQGRPRQSKLGFEGPSSDEFRDSINKLFKLYPLLIILVMIAVGVLLTFVFTTMGGE